jgi:NAD(P)-dependent dehydrogenase (short-subunit alcohol dehydrogenase family)
VTGGARGIGAMITAGLHAAGARVILASRDGDSCAAFAERLGSNAIALTADVSTVDGCQSLARQLGDHTDVLDVLVNNAGATWGMRLEQYPDSAWDKVLSLNLKAPFHLTVACLPLLRAAASTGRTPRVINIGSADGCHIPNFESYAYSSSKAGLHHLTRHLAKRLAREGITVNAIAPGWFRSRMSEQVLEDIHDDVIKSIPLGRLGEPSDIAGAAIYLASPAGSWITGSVITVDGGLTGVL